MGSWIDYIKFYGDVPVTQKMQVPVFKKPNNNAPKNIKGDYDLSIHGNKIILVNKKDGTTVESKCHPDDNFDIGIGIKEVFKKLNQKIEENQKKEEEENKKIKVGDLVKIIDFDYQYMFYWEWLPNNMFHLVKEFDYGETPHTKKCRVMYIGKHENGEDNLIYIKDGIGKCYTFNLKGLKKVEG